MIRYTVTGGYPLNGSIAISGAKNAAVAILPATLLVDGVCCVENVPDISDVRLLLQIVHDLGADVRRLSPNTVRIDASHARYGVAPEDLVRKIRASYYLLGAQLGRFGRTEVALPGGCDFGSRPIDQHIKGFETLGANVLLDGGTVRADTIDGRLRGAHVYLDFVSVGATMNTMIAAVLAEGTTVIEPCAKEPHVVDLANFLNAMGAHITGAGTDVIKVRGVDRLVGGTYSIIPDQIEAGTYMAAVAAAGGSVTLQGIIPKHMEAIVAKLREMGLSVSEYDDAIRVEKTRSLKAVNVKTQPYPGFPTDMQPQLVACMSCAEGSGIVTENIYDARYRYTGELARMGANISVSGNVAVVKGVRQLDGCTVRACDLRAGAAMIIAALGAHGETVIENAQYIERGYESVIEKLTAVGARITRQELPDAPSQEAAG